MGSITDAFTGGSAASGSAASSATDNLFNDASLGSQITGGGDLFSPNVSGTGSFDSFSNIVNALSGGNSPQAVQAARTSPAAATGGDPIGATGGTQSATSPGQTTQQSQQEQQAPAPKSSDEQGRAAAIPKLQDLINALEGKPKGPTFILPEVKPGETGPQSPVQSTTPLAKLVNQLVGAQSAAARLPPAPAPAPEGGDITVRPRVAAAAPRQDPEGGGGDAPAPAAAPPAAAPAPGPQGPQPAPAPTPQQAKPEQMSRLMRDIAGISTGNPAYLADLAMALYGIGAPLAIALGSRGGRPSMRPGGHPGVDYAGGYGEAQNLLDEEMKRQGTLDSLRYNMRFDKNGQPAPHGSFDRNGAFVASPEKTPTSNQIPGVNAKAVDDYVRQAAQRRGIDPNVASRMVGAESGYGQNNLGDRVNGQPTSFGPLQLHFAPDGRAMGDQFFHDTGQRPQDFAQNWKQQIDYALDKAAKGGWGPWTTSMNKLGLSKWSGINRQQPPVSIRPEGTNPRVSFLTSGTT